MPPIFIQWLIMFVLSNPALIAEIELFVQNSPNIPKEVKDALKVAIALLPYYAQKKAGWVEYKPDDGSPAVNLAHVIF